MGEAGPAADAAVGMVSLVGAGPGDPELLTLRAVRVLGAADVVVYDRLIGAAVLEFIRKDATRFYVGKARNDHVRTQDEINALLIAEARAGRQVVRLKGGDPFLFGRGGEEIEALRAAAVSYQVVPGITAATGCAAAAEIPLTHRDLAHSCTFLTGHFSQAETEVDWRALAGTGQTLVFYMGVFHLSRIAENLLRHGRSPTTPAAIVQDGTRPTQRIWMGVLAELGQETSFDHRSPGLVIVGETVRLGRQAMS